MLALVLALGLAIGSVPAALAQEAPLGMAAPGAPGLEENPLLYGWQEIGMGLRARVIRLRDEVAGLTVQVAIQNPTRADVTFAVVSVALRGRTWDHNGNGGKLDRRNTWIGSDSRYVPLVPAGGRVIVEFGPAAYRDIPIHRVTAAHITVE